MSKFTLKQKPFRPRAPPEILAKVSHFSTELLWKLEKITQRKQQKLDNDRCQKETLMKKTLLNPCKMALISTQNTAIMMEVSSSTSSSCYPFCYPSSLFSVYPSSFALIPTRDRLSIGARQCRQETSMIKTLQSP